MITVKNISFISKLDSELVRFDDIIASYFGEDISIIETPQDFVFVSKLDTFSGEFSTIAFSSIDNFLLFKLLKEKTKKVSNKLLASFVELNDTDKMSVLRGMKKIKGLGASVITQLKDNESLIFKDSKNIEEVNRINSVISSVYEDTEETISTFIDKNYNLIQGKSEKEILHLFLTSSK